MNFNVDSVRESKKDENAGLYKTLVDRYHNLLDEVNTMSKSLVDSARTRNWVGFNDTVEIINSWATDFKLKPTVVPGHARVTVSLWVNLADTQNVEEAKNAADRKIIELIANEVDDYDILNVEIMQGEQI